MSLFRMSRRLPVAAVSLLPMVAAAGVAGPAAAAPACTPLKNASNVSDDTCVGIEANTPLTVTGGQGPFEAAPYNAFLDGISPGSPLTIAQMQSVAPGFWRNGSNGNAYTVGTVDSVALNIPREFVVWSSYLGVAPPWTQATANLPDGSATVDADINSAHYWDAWRKDVREKWALLDPPSDPGERGQASIGTHCERVQPNGPWSGNKVSEVDLWNEPEQAAPGGWGIAGKPANTAKLIGRALAEEADAIATRCWDYGVRPEFVGPSEGTFRPADIQAFINAVDYLNGVHAAFGLPAIRVKAISWHEAWGLVSQPSQIASHVAQVRAMLQGKNLGMTGPNESTGIEINEYGTRHLRTSDDLVSAGDKLSVVPRSPANVVAYMAEMLKAGVDRAAHTCWDLSSALGSNYGCRAGLDGRFDQSGQPLAPYYVYKAVADHRSTLAPTWLRQQVGVTRTGGTPNVYGLAWSTYATSPPTQTDLLIGRSPTATGPAGGDATGYDDNGGKATTVQINHLQWNSGTVKVAIQRIPNALAAVPSLATSTVTKTVTASGTTGSIRISLPRDVAGQSTFASGDAYRISITRN